MSTYLPPAAVVATPAAAPAAVDACPELPPAALAANAAAAPASTALQDRKVEVMARKVRVCCDQKRSTCLICARILNNSEPLVRVGMAGTTRDTKKD